MKKPKPKKPKRKNPADLTLRNNRARVREMRKINTRLFDLEFAVEELRHLITGIDPENIKRLAKLFRGEK